MRNDDRLATEMQGSPEWKPSRFSTWLDSGRNSFSGHEPNRLFLSVGAKRFDDVSGISGLDTTADSRAFVIWDYDRDGWQDIALVNAGNPLLNLFRNEIGESGVKAGVIALRFVGGNRTTHPSAFACRDGYGAIATLDLGDLKIKRAHRCGEGFAAQNSATLVVGIGDRKGARSVTVRWPSGKTQTIKRVAAGALLTAHEDGLRFETEPYLRRASAPAPKLAPAAELLIKGADAGRPQLRMLTTMATWCEACKREQPQIAHLRKLFEADELQMFGLPTDRRDDKEKLEAYARKHQPAYTLLTVLADDDRERIEDVLAKSIRTTALPATIVTDGDGHVLQVFRGVPTASDLRRLRAR